MISSYCSGREPATSSTHRTHATTVTRASLAHRTMTAARCRSGCARSTCSSCRAVPRFRHVHYGSLRNSVIVFKKRLWSITSITSLALVRYSSGSDPQCPPERGAPLATLSRSSGVRHEHVLVVRQLLSSLRACSRNMSESGRSCTEIAPGSVEAAMIAAGHLHSGKLFVLADQQFVSLGKLLLHRHDFGDVDWRSR